MSDDSAVYTAVSFLKSDGCPEEIRRCLMYPFTSETQTVRITEEYWPMSDGVRLYTRIVVPAGMKSCPIVYIRTPYEPEHHGQPHDPQEYEQDPFILKGYAIVLQHCRGTGDSEGVCVAYRERQDGLDTLEHIRRLPIYQQEVYPYGGSYLSTVHLSYLDTNPADIKGAVLNIQTDRMYFRNYRNGCCFAYCNLGWWLGMLKRRYPKQRPEAVPRRPYRDLMKRIVGEDVPEYTQMLMNDTYNDFWKADPRTEVMTHLQIPVLFTEGWYDFYLEGMFSMWERMPDETRKKSAFIIGPWGHATAIHAQAAYRFENGDIPADYAAMWFDSIRNGTEYPYARRGMVNYYSLCGERWEHASAFGEKKKRLYLGTDRKAISYRYDPAASDGEQDSFSYCNVYKAKEPDTQEGLISFFSEEAAEEQSFYGKIRWHMYVQSDCEDTAFLMRVYFTEGEEAYNLTETITSLSNLDPAYRPGEPILIDLETPPIGFTLKKGSRIRIDITSHGGIYVPHANVRGHWAEVTEEKVAHNTIFCEEAYVELPII